jgi:hypothetical protein
VALNDFGNMAQLLYGILLASNIAHTNRDEGAHIEAQRLGSHHQAAALNDTHILQFLYALVDGSTRDTALTCNLKEGRAGVLYQEAKDFSIRCV